MNDLNLRLQSVFLFDNADLRNNRRGRLSPRQQARLQAAGKSQRLAMTVFVVVMVGSLAVIALGALLSGPAGGSMALRDLVAPLAVIATVIGAAVLFGLVYSRRYMVGGSVKRMAIVRGPAAVGKIKEDAAHFELVIGATRLRLLTIEQLEAFTPGVDYRVFYIPGPVPALLSAEVVGTEAESDAVGEAETAPLDKDTVVQMQGRARPILWVLAGLALGIPLLGIAASFLPEGVQWLVWVAMLVAGFGFVYWTLRRLGR